MVSIASDMTRLRSEITKEHQARVHLIDNLHHFADNLSCEIKKTLHSITESRKKKAKNEAADRHSFVVNLQHNVSTFRNDFATELQNARCGWFGEGSPVTCTGQTKTKPVMKGKKSN